MVVNHQCFGRGGGPVELCRVRFGRWVKRSDLGFTKIRYRGLVRNLNRMNVLLASANWVMRPRVFALPG